MPNTNTSAGAGAAIAPRPTSKYAAVVESVRRPEGATLEQLTAAIGWQLHTARAALTGLKKKAIASSGHKTGSAATTAKISQ